MRFWSDPGRQKDAHGQVSPDHFGARFRPKNRKNVIQKGMQNSMPKKYRKLMANGSQNDAKMDAKIYENSCFSEKG